jgi:hypothetical protein
MSTKADAYPHTFRTLIGSLLGMTVLAVLSGCGTLYELEVRAVNPESSKLEGTYVLIPQTSDIDRESAEFMKFADQIERGLANSELQRLPSAQLADADMIIVVDYQVGDPELVGHSSEVPMFQSRGSVESEEGAKETGGRPRPSQGANAPTGVVDAPPTKELVGTQAYTFVRTVYWRELSLRAITFDWDGSDFSSISRTGSLWIVMVSSLGSSGDLNEVMPVMIAAVQPYIGVHSEELIVEKMNGIDKRIKAISEGN